MQDTLSSSAPHIQLHCIVACNQHNHAQQLQRMFLQVEHIEPGLHVKLQVCKQETY